MLTTYAFSAVMAIPFISGCPCEPASAPVRRTNNFLKPRFSTTQRQRNVAPATGRCGDPSSGGIRAHRRLRGRPTCRPVAAVTITGLQFLEKQYQMVTFLRKRHFIHEKSFRATYNPAPRVSSRVGPGACAAPVIGRPGEILWFPERFCGNKPAASTVGNAPRDGCILLNLRYDYALTLCVQFDLWFGAVRVASTSVSSPTGIDGRGSHG